MCCGRGGILSPYKEPKRGVVRAFGDCFSPVQDNGIFERMARDDVEAGRNKDIGKRIFCIDVMHCLPGSCYWIVVLI